MGIEPTSSAWKAEVIAIIRCPHPETRLPSSFCNKKEIALFNVELISLPNQLRLRKASPESGGGGRIRTFEVDDGRFTVCSLWPLGNPTQIVMVPTTGIELVTYWLQVSCSTYWAKSASSSAHSRETCEFMQLKICIKRSLAHILCSYAKKRCNFKQWSAKKAHSSTQNLFRCACQI